MISRNPITETASWKECVFRTRIYYDEKGCRESLTRNHNFALREAAKTWHITTLGEVTANHQANPLREYYDLGMRVVGSQCGGLFKFNNVREMIAAATILEQQIEPMAMLCALRLRLACTGWDRDRIAAYLSLSRRMLRRFDRHMTRVCEMHEPRNPFYQVALARKRKPRAGWAKEIFQKYLKLRKELKLAKSRG